MKIREGGAEHEKGNVKCPACAVIQSDAHHPQQCNVDGCSGLRHPEFIGGPARGTELEYLCDECGELFYQELWGTALFGGFK